MFCTNCGTQLSDDAKFCFKCGTAVVAAVEQSAVQPTTQVVGKTSDDSARLESYLKDVWELSKEIMKVDYVIEEFNLKRECYQTLRINTSGDDDAWSWNEFLPEEHVLYENTLQSFFPNTEELDLHCVFDSYKYGDRFINGPIWLLCGDEGMPNDINGRVEWIKNFGVHMPEIIKNAFDNCFKGNQLLILEEFNHGRETFFSTIPRNSLLSKNLDNKRDFLRKYDIRIPQDDFILKNDERLKDYVEEHLFDSLGNLISETFSQSILYLVSNRPELQARHIKECDDEIVQLKSIRERLVASLDAVYAKGNICSKYHHNYIASGMFYDYIVSKRCYDLDGPDGAYNLYENEIRLNTIINNQEIIIDKLDELAASMRSVASQLSAIQSELGSIHATLNTVDYNTRIAAMNSNFVNVCVEVSSRY